MAEFFAWAATGIVAGLQSWSRNAAGHGMPSANGAVPAPIVDRQRFFLRQQNGRNIEILLVDSGIAFRNGQAVTAVWSAREKSAYGHCIYLENHTTGAIARLHDNLALIRRKTRWWEIALFGFLATLPATIFLIAWLALQRGTGRVYDNTFFLSAVMAALLLFIIGIVASKLVFDYMRTEEERKIWLAADKALFHARRLLIQKPQARYHG
jgi:hypothetical protein